MSQVRRQRLEELILRAMSHLLQSNSSRMEPKGMVTVTAVQLSRSLEEAKVYLSTFHSPDPRACFKALEAQLPFIQKQLALQIGGQLRRLPRVRLIEDDAQLRAERIEQLLRADESLQTDDSSL